MKHGHGNWTVARNLAGLSSLFQDPAQCENRAPTAQPVSTATEQADQSTPASHIASVFPPSGEIGSIRSPRTRRAKKSLPVAVWGVAIACAIMVGIVAALKLSTDSSQRELAAAVAADQQSESATPPIQPLDIAEPPSGAPRSTESPSTELPSAESPGDPRGISQRERPEPDQGQNNRPSAESSAADPPADPPATQSLGVATFTVVPRVTVTVNGRPVPASPDESTSDRDAPDGNRPPTSRDAKPAAAPSAPETAPAIDVGNRLPIPNAKSIAEALRLAKELFAEDYSAAKTADGRRALAAKLLSVAKDTKDDPAARFVLLEESANAAASGGDFDLACEAIVELESQYQIEGLDRRVGVLTAVAKNVAKDDTDRFVELSLDVVSELVDGDKYEEAIRLLKLVASRAKRNKNADLMAKITRREKQITSFAARFDGARAARVVLDKKPDDPKANRIYGEYLCLVKDDWATGCQHLARGDSPGLKATAEAELAEPDEGDNQVALGDAWWALADEYEDTESEQVRRRAVLWYDKCLASLSGLSKVRVEKRIAEAGPTSIPLKPVRPITIDLLAHLDVKSGSEDRTWTLDDNVLVGGGPSASTFTFTQRVSGDYDLSVVFRILEREKNGSSDIIFPLPVVNTYLGFRSTVDHKMIVGMFPIKNIAPVDFTLREGVDYQATVKVRNNGSTITVGIDGIQPWTMRRATEATRHNNESLAITLSPKTRVAFSRIQLRETGLPSRQSETTDTAKVPPVGEVRCFRGHDRAVWSVAVARSGRMAYSYSGDKTLREWDLSPTATGVARVIDSNVGGEVVASPTEDVIVYGRRDGTICRLKTNQANAMPDNFGEGGAFAFSEDGKRLAVLTSSGLTVWSLGGAHPEETVRFKNGLPWAGASIAYSRDNLLAVGLFGEKTSPVDILVFRVNETSIDSLMALSGHINSVRRIAFSPDGTLLASAGFDGAIRVWNVKTKKLMRQTQHVEAPAGVMTSVAFSPSGKRILVCGGTWKPGNGVIRLLDARTGKQIAQFDGHTTVVSQVVFTPDGTMAVSGAEDRTVRLWNLPAE
jgi:hypothetical protein